MLCWLGPIILSKSIGFPIFSQISLILVDKHQFLPIFFQFCTMYPFIDPQFLLFLFFQAACGTPVILLPLRGGGFRKQLPPKLNPWQKPFFWSPPVTSFQSCWQCNLGNYCTACWLIWPTMHWQNLLRSMFVKIPVSECFHL